jgi:SAM-dependent methyltransferase
MRNYSRLDNFITDRAGSDLYPVPPAEPHISITRSAIQELWKSGLIRQGDRVLDIGCGQGLALDLFRQLGLEPTGITLGVDYEVCREKGFDVRELDQNFMDFPEDTFDFLWCRHVLEHSIAPIFTLSEYRRITKPGGHVYIEVPAPNTSAHHETNPNHYSVLPFSLWLDLFKRTLFEVVSSGELRMELMCGPDVYWWFLLRRPDAASA